MNPQNPTRPSPRERLLLTALTVRRQQHRFECLMPVLIVLGTIGYFIDLVTPPQYALFALIMLAAYMTSNLALAKQVDRLIAAVAKTKKA
ncbi:hypothetical protein GCM10007895_18610 [Paraferrimonas sedimenticola]|uniref:Uncharacterized protein n=2 Tax=Paraferrimonas sedimenticola TaxID=375674 RepID=A0AA37RWE3_9GAMM|nr:hypothetical protein GCM10007895_18610 [Paraferrimonas sedimenticola]